MVEGIYIPNFVFEDSKKSQLQNLVSLYVGRYISISLKFTPYIKLFKTFKSFVGCSEVDAMGCSEF